MPCICLGHNYKDSVLNHPYFGTNAVINDLKSMTGWNDGHIVIQEDCVIRNKNGKVIKIIQN